MNQPDTIRSLARDLESVTRSVRTLRSDMESTAAAVVDQRDAERQIREDRRANHRNLNRALTLVGALVIGLIVTYTLQHGMWGSASKSLAPYSFTITIIMDSALAAYGFVRKY